MSALMVMGTGSDVGKSLIVAGLCRALKNRGLSVAPFKPQNMSNNAAVTKEGGEIGRAQALQARASGLDPSVEMNPVLLKPESETGSQVIVRGKRVATLSARDYFKERQRFLPDIMASFESLKKDHDIVLVEGAGSPAEVNLRKGDLANMGFASKANIPVLLVGDIHRGGVIASIVGTKALLPEEDARHIKAFLINNFHGDTSLFDEGLKIIIEKTGWASAGILPHFNDAKKLPAEDAVVLEKVQTEGAGVLKIAVPRLPRIANFDDIDPLRLEEGVSVTFIHEGEVLPTDADLILIPGSKATLSDLAFFKKQGWDIDLKAHIRRGGRVLGLCGGYQMLGEKLHDPNHIEGTVSSMEGLGHLAVETTLTEIKALKEVEAIHKPSKLSFKGYEMHLGETKGPDCHNPFSEISGKTEGAISKNGQIEGTYLHGLFADDAFRKAYLASLGFQTENLAYESLIEETLDALAIHIEKNVDVDLLLALAKGGRRIMTQVHGGSLKEAMRLSRKLGFDAGKKEDWLDLSTGINPHAYPLPEVTAEEWQKLPEPDDLKVLIKSAARYYGLTNENSLLAVSGSALAIQLLPFFIKNKKVTMLNLTYGDYGRAWPNHTRFQKLDELELGNIIVIANPNNPNGQRFSHDELSDFAKRNTQKGGFLIVDEAFGDLYPQESVINLTKTQNVIVLKSFGKFFGHGGARLGFIAAPDEIIEKLKPLLASWPVSGPTIRLGLTAYRDEKWHAETRTLLESETEKLTQLFQKADLAIKGQTSLFTLIETEEAGVIFHKLLENKIYVRPFLEHPTLLRFGLPKTAEDFAKLEKVLCS